jgi:hypothetical protein
LIIAEWLKKGVSQGKEKQVKTIVHIADYKAIIKAIKDVDLSADEALTIAETLKARGLLGIGITKAGPGRKELVPFLLNFWDFNKSDYIRDKLAHGHRITRRYCHEAALIVTRRWKFFANRTLNNITRQDIREFSLALHDTGLAAKTGTGFHPFPDFRRGKTYHPPKFLIGYVPYQNPFPDSRYRKPQHFRHLPRVKVCLQFRHLKTSYL